MRTKALVLAAAVVAGSVLTASAQTVYSVNAVGYVNLAVPQGFSMIANPLRASTNKLSALFATGVPDFTTIYIWNGTTYSTHTLAFGGVDVDANMPPGLGVFIDAPSAFTNTFVGEVVQSQDYGSPTTPITNPVPAGFSIRASIVPQEAKLSELGVGTALGDFDTVYVYNPATRVYTTCTFAFGGFDNDAIVKVGEAFWINAAVAKPWTRVFTVNP